MAAYSWSTITPPAGVNIGTMVLMTDGSVLGKQNGSPNWYRYFPDSATGLYGTSGAKWSSTVYAMSTERRWFASGVLPDGRFFVFGSESPTLNNGEILDLSAPNPQWQVFTPPSGFGFVLGDVNGCIIADGRVLLGGNSGSTQTALWDPKAFQGSATSPTEAWTLAGTGFGTGVSTKNSRPDEETWTLLPDGSVLTIDVNSGSNSTERYIPSTDQWINAGTTLSTMAWGSEMGPALVLPQDGTCYCVGASGHTAIYTPGATNPWSAGPDTGASSYTKAPGLQDSTIQTVADGPGCVLPNGKVLFCAGDPALNSGTSFSTNANFYLYDPKQAGTLPVLSSQPFSANSGVFTWQCCLLVLPSGEAFLSNISGIGSNLQLLTIGTIENQFPAAWQPMISFAPEIVLAGRSYTISGTQFNGLTSGNSYGDDLGNASNYPIVQLRSTGGGTTNVYYCRSYDYSSMGIATGTTPQTATIRIPGNVIAGQYTLTVIANGISSDSVLVEVVQTDIQFVMEMEEFSQGQVNAVLQNNNGKNAIIGPAFGIAVEGFKPSELGFNSVTDLGDITTPPANPPTITSPKTGLSFVCYGPVLAEDLSLPDTPQTFTYMFNAVFDNQTDANAIFVDPIDTEYLIANFTVIRVAMSAITPIVFTQSPNPYMLHGDAANNLGWWLSQDLRAFTILENDNSIFGVTMGTKTTSIGSADVATSYIQTVLNILNSATTQAEVDAATKKFESVNDLGDDNVSLGQTDNNGVPIYNFCIARVRYQDTQTAQNLRVFFRLWPGAQCAFYDQNTLFRSYPPGAAGPTGYKVPLLGTTTAGGDEIATVPFFATKRVNVNNPNVSMTSQPVDAPNLITSVAVSPKTVKYLYFGAWLDINQPDQKVFPSRLIGPSTASFPDGPFTGAQNIVSILDLLRSQHQCLIAEISMDGINIPQGSTCANTEHLAQRNLNFINVPNPGRAGSRRVSQPFEVRPTPASLAAIQRPDEIMLQWGTDLPSGSTVNVYLPVVQASDIIKLANQMYFTHKLSIVDTNTISAPGGGVTYIPLPPRNPPSGETFVGLMSLELPLGIRRGQEFGVIFKQITNGFSRFDQPQEEDNPEIIKVKGAKEPQNLLSIVQGGDAKQALGTSTSIVSENGRVSNFLSTYSYISGSANNEQIIGFQYRRVLGQFALQVPVSTKGLILPSEERLLSILKYIDQSVDPSTRWYLVWKRYLSDIIGRVGDLGGDPGSVLPDPNGGVTPNPFGDGRKKACGRICEVVFDKYGCFKRFKLRVEGGERWFESKEEGLGRLVDGICEREQRVCVYYRGCEVLEIAVEKGRSHVHGHEHKGCGCDEKHDGKLPECGCKEHDGKHEECK